MSIGIKIKELRKSKKLSQAEFGKRIGVSQTTVTAWETGRAEPASSYITSIANYFNVTTDYLLGRDGKEENQEQNADLASDDVIFTYEGKPIPKEDLELIRRLMRGTRNDI